MFEIYPWQTQQWRNLNQAVMANRLGHGLILSGASGLGKLQFANSLAFRLLCEANTETPCESCKSCRFLDAGSHPDFMRIDPSDKSRTIKVGDMRAWLGKTTLAPGIANFKIAVIDSADQMTTSAANSLLKILEEPAGNTIFILLDNLQKPLLLTIKSRCQSVLFTEPESDVALGWLKDQGYDNPELALLMANYAPLLAQGFDNDALSDYKSLVISLFDLKFDEVFPLALKWSKDEHHRILSWWQGLVAVLIKTSQGIQAKLPLSVPDSGFDIVPLHRFYQTLQQSRKDLAGGSVNARLVFDNLLLKWYRIST